MTHLLQNIDFSIISLVSFISPFTVPLKKNLYCCIFFVCIFHSSFVTVCKYHYFNDATYEL